MLASRSDWRSERRAYEETHGIFREQVRRFYTDEMQQHGERWEREGVTDRAFWQRAGAQGLQARRVLLRLACGAARGAARVRRMGFLRRAPGPGGDPRRSAPKVTPAQGQGGDHSR